MDFNQGTPTEKFLRKMVKDLKRAVDSDAHNRKNAIDDLKFLNIQQWPTSEIRRRELANRPVLTVNMLPKYINQMVGDERQNRPRIKILPVDDRADPVIAGIREGLISNIEYNSDAPLIYDDAFESCIKCGYGAWRVLTREVEYNPFEQEIFLEAIPNPFMVYLDPECKSPTYSDATYGFILEKLSKEEFKRKYPKAKSSGTELDIGIGLGSENWFDKDLITVAEYFKKDTQLKPMVQLEDGSTLTREEFDEKLKVWEEKYESLITKARQPPQGIPPTALGILKQGQPPPQQPQIPGAQSQPPTQQTAPQMQVPPTAPPASSGQQPSQTPEIPKELIDMSLLGDKPTIAKERNAEEVIIRHWICTATEILSKNGLKGEEFPGKYIPIVLLTGERTNIEGKTYIKSLIRDAKDAQKILNYWVTAAAEMVALAPKSPWLGTVKQFQGFEDEYATSNIENHPFLRYNVDPDAPGPPIRNQPGQPPTALFTQISVAEAHLKSVIGMFNADVGAGGSEQTGSAVRARQTPGDVGTFRYMDNLSRCIAFGGKIINDMISEVYDTARDVRLRHFDGTDSYVPINTTVGDAIDLATSHPDKFKKLDIVRLTNAARKYGRDAKFNDFSIGKYDAIVTVGPSYTTQRQESAAAILSLVNSMPQQMAIGADILVKNMDFKGAEELSDRLKKTLPPGLIEPREGEPPPTPLPPNPAQLVMQAKLQTEQLKGESEKAKIQLETIKLQTAQLKTENEKLKMMLKQKDLQHTDTASARSHELDKMKLSKEMIDSKQSIKDAVVEVLSDLQKMNMQRNQQ